MLVDPGYAVLPRGITPYVLLTTLPPGPTNINVQETGRREH